MKRIYEKPSLVVESFVTEEIMDEQNLLSETVTNVGYEGNSNFINFQNGSDNVLGAIDYTTFKN